MTNGLHRLATGVRNRARQQALLRYLIRRRRAKKYLIDWRSLGARPTAGKSESKRILVATSVGGFLNGSIVESLLAATLELRGHEIHVLLCDSALPACLECTYVQLGSAERMAREGPQASLCGYCYQSGRQAFQGLEAVIHTYNELLAAADRDEAKRIATSATLRDAGDIRLEGLAIGEHALAGALRFFARATLEEEPQALPVLQRYVEAAVLTARATQSLLRKYQFDAAVFHHGIYVPQGLIGEVARAEGVHVVNWNPAYRSHSLIFSHENTYHQTLLDEPIDTWESVTWNEALQNETLAYLESRWTGSRDWIWFHESGETERAAIEREVGIDFSSRPTIGLLTNVMWDAQLHYRANAFETMSDWIRRTVEWFADHPELQLLIRVHPAEVSGSLPSRQRVVDDLSGIFPVLPQNVFIVRPESNISTYASMLNCNSVIIYGTKTGVELTSLGVPIIVAGEAWIRGKGLSVDISTKSEYIEVLNTLPFKSRLDASGVNRARKYAFHFFFRRMIPVDMLIPTGVSDPVYRATVGSWPELAAGQSLGLDIICHGITEGTPFVYPAEDVLST